MTDAPRPLVLFVPVLPDNHSAANLRNAHVNLSNLWLMAAILFMEAGMYEKYIKSRQLAWQHAHASNFYGRIATLGYFMRNLEGA